jgi:hypothetical protein
MQAARLCRAIAEQLTFDAVFAAAGIEVVKIPRDLGRLRRTLQPAPPAPSPEPAATEL